MTGDNCSTTRRYYRYLVILSLCLFTGINGQGIGCVPPARRTDGVWHEVKRGQTLWRIARTYGVDLYELADINNIEDPARIRAGTRLFIPGAKKVVDVKPYRAPAIVDTKGVKGEKATVTKIVHGSTGNSACGVKLAWPLDGVLTSRFGMRSKRRHDGIDIAAPMGTPVKAAAKGEVVYAKFTGGYGNLLILKHNDRLLTIYAHLKEFLVDTGDRVEAGQVIGRVGDTGRATGPHLHFEIRLDREPRDPLLFLPGRK